MQFQCPNCVRSTVHGLLLSLFRTVDQGRAGFLGEHSEDSGPTRLVLLSGDSRFCWQAHHAKGSFLQPGSYRITVLRFVADQLHATRGLTARVSLSWSKETGPTRRMVVAEPVLIGNTLLPAQRLGVLRSRYKHTILCLSCLSSSSSLFIIIHHCSSLFIIVRSDSAGCWSTVRIGSIDTVLSVGVCPSCF